LVGSCSRSGVFALRLAATPLAVAKVAGCYLFYNRSAFDGDYAAADDAAIAPTSRHCCTAAPSRSTAIQPTAAASRAS
jgi:hypothetical protein